MTDSHISTIKGNRRPLPKVRRAHIGSKSGAAFRSLTIVLFACIRHYFPRQGGNLNCAGAHHGTLTPPRISPSCPHYVPLWLGRSTIVRGQDHCEAACQSCFWMDGYRSSPCWAVFVQQSCTGGLRASAKSLSLIGFCQLMYC